MGKPAPASASDLIPPIRAGIVDQNGEARPGTGARFVQPFVDFGGRRMLLDDATGGGFVLLASSADVALTGVQQAWFERIGGRRSSSVTRSEMQTAISPPGWPRMTRLPSCCGRIFTCTASRATLQMSLDW